MFCSVLWWLLEIVIGNDYNESVDLTSALIEGIGRMKQRLYATETYFHSKKQTVLYYLFVCLFVSVFLALAIS